MAKETINMGYNKNIIELSNIEIYEHCILDVITGEKNFNKGKKKIKNFTGLYFRDECTFFGIYPTEHGPIMYYEGVEYSLNKKLHITLVLCQDLAQIKMGDFS